MIFNVANNKAKAQAQRALLRRELGIERAFSKTLRAALNEAYAEAASQLEQQSTAVGLDALLDQWMPDLFSAYLLGYRRAGASFLRLVQDAMARLKFTRAPETKYIQDDFWFSFNKFIATHTGSRVTRVNKTTKKFVRRVIDKGVKDGKSYGEIAKDLRKKKRFNWRRAKRIARTEVHMVSNYSTQEAVKATRLEGEKEWVAFIDERTRVDHIKANGTRVAINDDFVVGGALMQYPGDPRGGAKNVVHCRCVLLYHTKRRAEQQRQRPAAKPVEFKPTKEMREAAQQYTGSHNVYINEALRKGKSLDDELAEEVKQMDLLLKKAPKYKGELYRGIGSDIWKTKKGKAIIKPGAVFSDKGYISTTSSKNYFKKNFMEDYKGVNCYIQAKRGVPISRYSQFKAEKEVLLPRGSKFKVLKAEQDKKNKNIWNVWLKEL